MKSVPANIICANGNIEFRYASSIVWIFHFQLRQFLFHLLLSCALESELDSDIVAAVIKLSVVVFTLMCPRQ
jgi:hypothetical protein